MSERGLCSRREADEWISNGWVKVDGVPVTVLGTRARPNARIDIDPAAKNHEAALVTILLHKPTDYGSGWTEEGLRPAGSLIAPENQWEGESAGTRHGGAPTRGSLHGLAPAGRLDAEASGLLVLTQEGGLAKRLATDRGGPEREYIVRIEGELSANGLLKLKRGLSLDERPLAPAEVSWQSEEQLRMVLRESRPRLIWRMCEAVGVKVVSARCIRIGSVSLAKMPVGKWRYLGPHEKF